MLRDNIMSLSKGAMRKYFQSLFNPNRLNNTSFFLIGQNVNNEQ